MFKVCEGTSETCVESMSETCESMSENMFKVCEGTSETCDESMSETCESMSENNSVQSL